MLRCAAALMSGPLPGQLPAWHRGLLPLGTHTSQSPQPYMPFSHARPGFVLVVAAAKAYLDNYGPYSAKVARLKSGLEEQQQLEGVGDEQQLAGGGSAPLPSDLHGSQAGGTSGNRGSLEAQRASEAERGTGRGGAQQRAVVAPGPQPSGGVRQRGQHP